MKTRYFSLIVSVALVLCLFSGCGSTADKSAESSAPTQSAQGSDKSTPEASAAAAAAVSGDASSGASSITYPIAKNDVTFTLWKPTNAQFATMFSSYEENKTLVKINEATGIDLDFIEPSDTVATEQFNLMIASGEYPDFLDCTTYTGGLGAAYSDGIIYDLTDDIPNFAPDYWSSVQNANEETLKSLKDDEGRMYAIYTINNTYFVERGLEIRKDWLDTMGLEVPKTTDQLYDTMLAIYNKYNTPYTFNIDANGIMSYIIGAFGISGFDLSGTSSLGFYHDGDTVLSSLQQDGYREYIEYLKKFYDSKLIGADFYTAAMGPSTKGIDGDSAMWYGMADAFSSDKAQTTDPNFNAVGVGAIVKNEGDTYEFGDLPTMTGRANISISTSCEDLELAMNYINWFFTDPGFVITNYGIEGESFNYNAAGEPEYTDLVINNPSGWNKVNAKVVLCFWNIMPFYNAQDALLYTYVGNETQAMDTWTEMGYSKAMPALSYLPEETEEYSTLVTDIATFATQEVLAFIVGEKELNDENWTSLQDKLNEMDISRAIEITQTAFNRYQSR